MSARQASKNMSLLEALQNNLLGCYVEVFLILLFGVHSWKIMGCHSAELKKEKSISVHLVDRVFSLEKEDKLTGAVVLQTGQDTHCYILCMAG